MCAGTKVRKPPPNGQLVFFAEFLATAGIFERWVEDCPLAYTSPNAPTKRDVLGTLLLAILAGHKRYGNEGILLTLESRKQPYLANACVRPRTCFVWCSASLPAATGRALTVKAAR